MAEDNSAGLFTRNKEIQVIFRSEGIRAPHLLIYTLSSMEIPNFYFAIILLGVSGAFTFSIKDSTDDDTPRPGRFMTKYRCTYNPINN